MTAGSSPSGVPWTTSVGRHGAETWLCSPEAFRTKHFASTSVTRHHASILHAVLEHVLTCERQHRHHVGLQLDHETTAQLMPSVGSYRCFRYGGNRAGAAAPFFAADTLYADLGSLRTRFHVYAVFNSPYDRERFRAGVALQPSCATSCLRHLCGSGAKTPEMLVPGSGNSFLVRKRSWISANVSAAHCSGSIEGLYLTISAPRTACAPKWVFRPSATRRERQALPGDTDRSIRSTIARHAMDQWEMDWSRHTLRF